MNIEKSENVLFMSKELEEIFDPSDLEDNSDTKKIETSSLRFFSYSKEKSLISVVADKKFIKSVITATEGNYFKKNFFDLEFVMSNEHLEITESFGGQGMLVTLKVVSISGG